MSVPTFLALSIVVIHAVLCEKSTLLHSLHENCLLFTCVEFTFGVNQHLTSTQLVNIDTFQSVFVFAAAVLATC